MHRRRAEAAFFIFALGSSGCYGNFDSFAQRLAKLQCKRFANCEPSDYADAYGDDHQRCRDDMEDALQDEAAIYELADLEYDSTEGRLCLETSYSARNDCGSDATEDIADACEEVFN